MSVVQPGADDRGCQQGQSAVRTRHLRDGGAHRPHALAAAPGPVHLAQRPAQGVAHPRTATLQRQVPR